MLIAEHTPAYENIAQLDAERVAIAALPWASIVDRNTVVGLAGGSSPDTGNSGGSGPDTGDTADTDNSGGDPDMTDTADTGNTGGSGPDTGNSGGPAHSGGSGPATANTGGSGTGGEAAPQATELTGMLEIPGPSSFQSGVGVLSGWICEAEVVTLEVEGGPSLEAAYGAERPDTEPTCGTTATGFGVLFNWNRLGDGEHTMIALADGVEFARATFTVTTLGEDFVRGAMGETVVTDFPSPGEEVRLRWQQNQQNFVIVPSAP